MVRNAEFFGKNGFIQIFHKCFRYFCDTFKPGYFSVFVIFNVHKGGNINALQFSRFF